MIGNKNKLTKSKSRDFISRNLIQHHEQHGDEHTPAHETICHDLLHFAFSNEMIVMVPKLLSYSLLYLNEYELLAN